MRVERRVNARGLLLEPGGTVLLLETRLPWLPSVWMVPGGGVEKGESLQSAAAREVAEETGLKADVGPELWWRDVTIELEDRRMEMREHFFLVDVERFEPDFTGLLDYERRELLSHRWWSAVEIGEPNESFAPPELGVLLQRLVREGPPSSPLEIESRVHAVSR